MCHQIFEKKPETWLLHIRGYEWDFMKDMTVNANKNLKKALSYLKQFISSKNTA
jgi:hypothetical protein